MLTFFSSLKDQVKKAVPFLEVFNQDQLMETGQKYKEEILKLKQELLGAKYVGTHAGDRLLEDAENDPTLKLNESPEKEEPSMDASYG
jgi:hypothetical protein